MITNANLTLYSRGIDPSTRAETWTRSQIQGVFWQSTKAANILQTGLLNSDKYTIYIPMDRGSLAFKEGDVIVKGLVTDTITSNFTMGALKAKYPFVATITSVDYHEAGSQGMKHWQIGAS